MIEDVHIDSTPVTRTASLQGRSARPSRWRPCGEVERHVDGSRGRARTRSDESAPGHARRGRRRESHPGGLGHRLRLGAAASSTTRRRALGRHATTIRGTTSYTGNRSRRSHRQNRSRSARGWSSSSTLTRFGSCLSTRIWSGRLPVVAMAFGPVRSAVGKLVARSRPIWSPCLAWASTPLRTAGAGGRGGGAA